VFQNRVLRGEFGRERDEVTGGWRKNNEELRNSYSSLNIIRVIKSRRKRRETNVARMEDMRNAYKHLVAKPEG
jgi:hypothetical protein